MIRVAFDLDNVLFNILEAARSALANDNRIDRSEILDTWIYFAPFTHADPAVAARLVTDHDFWQREDVISSVTPLPGAVEAMKRLDREGMLGGYVTRRPPKAMGITRATLEFNGFPARDLYAVGHDVADRNHDACKAETCIAMGATHLVEDSQHEAASALVRGISPILVDHPLGRALRNEWHELHPRVPLARDAAHAVEMLLS